MSTIERKKTTMRIYGCGGTGINIAKQFLGQKKGISDSADLDITLIDSSDANFKDINVEHTYQLKGVNGGGKIRAEILEVARKQTPDILIKHPPGDFNVVVFSGMGGTGSIVSSFIINL